MTTYIQLGRLGDLCNAAKICLHEHRRTGERVRLVVAREFAPFLEAFSYIEPVVIEETQDFLPTVIKRQPNAIVLQSWMNPEQRHETDSYQKEAWRRAGKLDAFGTMPLVLDRRDATRELQYSAKWSMAKPLILVATQSPSSPFSRGQQLMTALWETFSETHLVVDTSLILADKPQDLLGLIDRAALLVTIDSFPLHLSEASRCPVIAILNDVGTSATPGSWASSVAPPQSVGTFKYSGFVRDAKETGFIASFAESILTPKTPRIIHAVQLHGMEPRHYRAAETWIGKIDVAARGSKTGIWRRTAVDIGDARNLPYLKDVIRFATLRSTSPNDIIFWCNDDNVISPKLPELLRRHVPLYGACSFRRTEPATLGIHMGREGFAFTARWFSQNVDSIPDYILGASSWDIGLAAYIRLQRGIVTTKANLTHDFFPADIGEGYVYHEAHPSAWSGANENSPSNQHNRRLLAEWQKKNIPQVKEVLA